jgi:hypothetical protein
MRLNLLWQAAACPLTPCTKPDTPCSYYHGRAHFYCQNSAAVSDQTNPPCPLINLTERASACVLGLFLEGGAPKQAGIRCRASLAHPVLPVMPVGHRRRYQVWDVQRD